MLAAPGDLALGWGQSLQHRRFSLPSVLPMSCEGQTSPRSLLTRLPGRQKCRRSPEFPEPQRRQEGRHRQEAQAHRGRHHGRLCRCQVRLVALETRWEQSYENPQPDSACALLTLDRTGSQQGRGLKWAGAGRSQGQSPCGEGLGGPGNGTALGSPEGHQGQRCLPR